MTLEIPPAFAAVTSVLFSLLLVSGCSSVDTADRALVVTTVASPPDPTSSTPTTADSITTSTTSVTPLQGDYTAEVIATVPHDPLAYTQGLEWHEGWLYESTGKQGSSDRRRLDPLTGEVDLFVPLDDDLFGEGLTIVGDELLQLTWQEGELQRSGLGDLETRATQLYEGEGWGLCHDGEQLIMSDGSSTLTRRDPATFEVMSSFQVTANGQLVELLNELECVGGQVFANVYGLDQIVVIDPISGIVVAVVDATRLRPDGLSPDDNEVVLNGLAYQPESGHWFVTGKYWPTMYEVEFVAS